MKDLDILEIISDTKMDQGNVDLAKALVMTLEQKVFKKTGLIDDKIKHLDESMHKLENEQTVNREFGNLLAINDQYPKYVVTMDEFWKDNIEGIKHLHITDFLLGEII